MAAFPAARPAYTPATIVGGSACHSYTTSGDVTFHLRSPCPDTRLADTSFKCSFGKPARRRRARHGQVVGAKPNDHGIRNVTARSGSRRHRHPDQLDGCIPGARGSLAGRGSLTARIIVYSTLSTAIRISPQTCTSAFR